MSERGREMRKQEKEIRRERQSESRSRDRSKMDGIIEERRSDVNEDRWEKGIGRETEPRRSEQEDFAFVLP